MKIKPLFPLLLLLVLFSIACGKQQGYDLRDFAYQPVPFLVPQPPNFPRMAIPEDNPMTQAGVALGQRLFFDPILSADSSMSCSSCHLPTSSFTDNRAFSLGIDGQAGKRSAMSLLNVGYFNTGLFWDGRSNNLEAQALIPVEDTVELHHTWEAVVEQLQNHSTYPRLFRQAFGIAHSREIDKFLVAKALAQYERTLLSNGTAKFDQVMQGLAEFTADEAAGYDMFFDVTTEHPDAECGHCHNAPLMTTNEYLNNGLNATQSIDDFVDPGYGPVSKNPYDYGKFRVPSLRNITLTAPYMHDGRFQTLEEVIEHYNRGGEVSVNVSPLIRPLNLNNVQKRQLIAFLNTLTDRTFDY